MGEDLTRRVPEYPTKINMNQSWEVQYRKKTRCDRTAAKNRCKS
jgi:hypothetical protein